MHLFKLFLDKTQLFLRDKGTSNLGRPIRPLFTNLEADANISNIMETGISHLIIKRTKYWQR